MLTSLEGRSVRTSFSRGTRVWLAACALTIAIFLPATAADAAGLGRMNVLSALGQPLNAEIELNATKDELSTMQVRIASADAYRRANLEYSAFVASVRLAIEQRRDGSMILRATTPRAVNDPFIELLVEVVWASGRLMREYTSLIDPPGFTAADSVAPPVAPAVAARPAVADPRPVVAAPIAPDAPAATVAPVKPAPVARAVVEKPAPRAAAPATAETATAAAGEYGPVRRGDTLARIAESVRPAGVSLDQMLVSLYRENKAAFDGSNMNRLRTGAVLRVPDAAALGATPAVEASREVRAQAADFNVYRQRLAGAVQDAPPVAADGGQAASGRIAPKVEEKVAAPASGSDVLRVSKGDPSKGAGRDPKAVQAAREKDATVREKALREANDRVVSLEKMLKDAQQLLDVQSKQLAELQKLSRAEPAKGAEPAKKAEPAKAEAPKPVPAAPEPKPEPAKAEAKPEPVAPPAPAPEPVKEEQPAAPKAPTVKAAAVPPVVSPAAYTDSSADPMTATHSNLEEVDPLAEAEVYLNYGRENQAEEILREAIAKSPSRQELYLKLLGIYVKRGDVAAFESVARKLYTVAGGTGASWQAAADMGASIDPANALYAGSSPVAKARPSAPAPVASSVAPAAIAAAAAAATLAPTPVAAALRPLDIEKTQVLSVDDLRPQGGPPTIDFDFEPAGPAATASPAISDLTLEIGGPAEAQSGATVTDMDFTLDFGAPGTLSVPELPDLPLEPPSEGTQTAEADLNFDPVFPVAGGAQGLPTPLFNSEATNVLLDSGPATGSIRDFKREAERAESGLSSADSMSGEPTQSSLGQDTMIMANPGELVTFDMTHPAGLPQNWQEATLPRVDLDLGDSQLDGRNPDKDEHWNDVNTKCDLAKAYEEMGDKDGAREILREVLAEGDAQQKADAEAMLARLG